MDKELKRLRLLIVDDDEMVRKLFVLILKNANCDVTQCNDGQAACAILSQNAYDIIFMDQVMPQMDGISCCKIIRERETESRCTDPVTIIGMTGSSEEEITDCLKAGMTDVMRKPFTKSNLINFLKTYTDFSDDKPKTIHADHPQPACFDKKIALDALDGNEDMFEQVVEMFTQTIPNLLTDFATAEQEQDCEQLKILSHTLKIRSLYVGATCLSELSSALEQHCKLIQLEQALQLVPDIMTEIHKLKKELELLA